MNPTWKFNNLVKACFKIIKYKYKRAGDVARCARTGDVAHCENLQSSHQYHKTNTQGSFYKWKWIFGCLLLCPICFDVQDTGITLVKCSSFLISLHVDFPSWRFYKQNKKSIVMLITLAALYLYYYIQGIYIYSHWLFIKILKSYYHHYV